LLNDRCLERGIFDPDMVRTVVENHRAVKHNHTFLIMAMMIFEVGQREFIDDASPANAMGDRAGQLCPTATSV
jgi:hypothetical protein